MQRAVRAALIGIVALTCTDAVAPDLVVPIQIMATPDRDTLTLADSLVLVIGSDGLGPVQVAWIIEPRADTLLQDTLIYRPRSAGTEYVRARASFPQEHVGSAVRRFVTLPNAAPHAVIRVLGGRVARVPLGDTIVLVAEVSDPDGDAIGPDARRWYLGDPNGDPKGDLLATGDTLRFPATAVATLRFHLVVTDSAGAYADGWYTTTAYDPVTPARWRTRVSSFWVTAVSRHPTGLILAHALSPIDPLRRVVALTDGGAPAWTFDTQISGTPLVVGDDGGVYQSGGSGTGGSQDETKVTKLDAVGSEIWTVAEAGATSGPVLLWDGGVAVPRLRGTRVLEPDGRERWTASVDSIEEVIGQAVGGDSTLYVLGYTPWPDWRASVSAYTPDGLPQWRILVGAKSTNWIMVPADDSTLLVGADSLYALRRDGSVRWSRAGPFSHPAIGQGRAYYALNNELAAVALVNGEEVWRVILPARSPGAPILTSGGDVVVAAGSTLLALDVGTGLEGWRHELAGTLTATLLVTDGGDLIAGDAQGFIEAIPVGARLLPAPWPMAWADERRTGRMRRP